MSAAIELKPGRTPLADWRAVYRGAAVTLDPFARPDVEAGASALAAILARNEPQPLLENGAPSLAEMMEKGGDRLPASLARLFVALKLGSLAQGMSGVRWETLSAIAGFLNADLLPAIPPEDVDDRIALSYLFAALTGTGEVVRGDKRRPAMKALKKAELAPLAFNPEERAALLSGSALNTASALAGLFEAERIFHSALVAAALSATALHRPGAPLHAHVHRLYRQPGQIETAATLRALCGPGESATPPPTSGNGADETAASKLPFQMGACLDLLRQAGATLEAASNAVTESPLVLWQSEEIVAGIEDRSSVARAGDLIALALKTICDLSEARIGRLTAGTESGDEDDGDRPALDARAGRFTARIHEHAEAASDVRRLLPMAGTAALVIAIESLEAARLLQETPGSAALHGVLRLLHEVAPRGAEAETMSAATQLAAIAERIGSGALAAAAGMALPSVAALT